MIFKIAVCDDEWTATKQISAYLDEISKDTKDEYITYYYHSGEELLENLPSDVQIFILDIQMGNLSGMDVAHILRDQGIDAYLFFVTSKIEYALEGYEVHAYSFFRKPLSFVSFKRNILEVCDQIKAKHIKPMIQLKGESTDTYLIEDILYIEVLKHTTTIYTSNEAKSYNNEPISQLEERLSDYHFFRCHKSYLINLNHIVNYTIDTITLDNGDEIPLSKHRKKDFKDTYTLYLGEQL